MISYFPLIYPDELLYSQLARYYAKSGYLSYRYVAEDLFSNRTARPDIEFVNSFTDEAFARITESMTMQEVILEHTMFPYYGRFLNKERRQKAFNALVSMQGNYHNLLPMPKSKEGTARYLRYCPVCSVTDREQYGETYWHRTHQMPGVKICPVHRCNLHNSPVIISGKSSPSLVTAEESIPMSGETLFSDNVLEIQTAKYTAEVFSSQIDFQSDVTAGAFFHSRMAKTKYLSVRGEQRNIALLHKDFTEYCRNLPDNRLTELWQIQKILTGDRINFSEICVLAMFLNISAAELVRMKLPEKSQEQLFDEQIFRLHGQGLNYREIAKQLNASYDSVKAIGEKRYGKYHKTPEKTLKCGTKARNWKQLDVEMISCIEDAIRQLQGDGFSRPKKISVYAVSKLLNLPDKYIDKLPLCKAEILNHSESQEQYWAREVIWAIKTIIREGQPVNWKHVRTLTNMKKKNLFACLFCLDELAKIEGLTGYVDMIVNRQEQEAYL